MHQGGPWQGDGPPHGDWRPSAGVTPPHVDMQRSGQQEPGQTSQFYAGYQVPAPLNPFNEDGPPPYWPPQSGSRQTAGLAWLAWIVAGVATVALLGVGGVLLLRSGDSAAVSSAAAAVQTSDGGLSAAPDSFRGGMLRPVDVRVSCQAPAGADSSGNAVHYFGEQTIDNRLDTAWRCHGSAVGEQLIYDFGRPVTITAVGLVPGYAKVDPFDGTNRFAQNRTVTGVSWLFDDGTALDQVIRFPSPSFERVDLSSPVTTRRVFLEIATTGNPSASRDYTVISEVAFEGHVAN